MFLGIEENNNKIKSPFKEMSLQNIDIKPVTSTLRVKGLNIRADYVRTVVCLFVSCTLLFMSM